MKKFDYNLFFTEHSLEEYKEYYSTHTNLETSKYFNISLRTIKQINRLYKVPTK